MPGSNAGHFNFCMTQKNHAVSGRGAAGDRVVDAAYARAMRKRRGSYKIRYGTKDGTTDS